MDLFNVIVLKSGVNFNDKNGQVHKKKTKEVLAEQFETNASLH